MSKGISLLVDAMSQKTEILDKGDIVIRYGSIRHVLNPYFKNTEVFRNSYYRDIGPKNSFFRSQLVTVGVNYHPCN